MRRIKIFFYLFFFNASLFGQSNATSDFLCVVKLRFNKIQLSTEEFNSAEMCVTYDAKNNNVLLNFIVPNDMARYTTTLSDFVIIETATNKVKLQNLRETVAEEASIYFNYWYFKNYTFSCSLPKENFVKLVNEGLIKVTFYFTPNKDYIKMRLAEEKLLNKSFVRYYGNNASKTIKNSASELDRAHYQELIDWLFKLKQS